MERISVDYIRETFSAQSRPQIHLAVWLQCWLLWDGSWAFGPLLQQMSVLAREEAQGEPSRCLPLAKDGGLFSPGCPSPSSCPLARAWALQVDMLLDDKLPLGLLCAQSPCSGNTSSYHSHRRRLQCASWASASFWGILPQAPGPSSSPGVFFCCSSFHRQMKSS